MFDPIVAKAVQPPERVLVDPLGVWPPDRFRWTTSTPLLAQSQGLQLRDPRPGLLRGFVRTQAGDWLGHVDWTVIVQGVEFALSSMVPIKALRPADGGERGPDWPEPND